MITITCDRCGKQLCRSTNANTAVAAIHDYHNDGNPERETLCGRCKPLELSLLPCPVCGGKPEVTSPVENYTSVYTVGCADYNPATTHCIEFSNNELKVAAAAWDDFAKRCANNRIGGRPSNETSAK